MGRCWRWGFGWRGVAGGHDESGAGADERGCGVIGGRMDFHVGKTVLAAVAAVLAALLTVLTLFTVVDELRDDTPGYTAANAFAYILFSTPRRVCELTPYAVFVGALAGLGALAKQSELTVLRAAGVSKARLFGAAALPALLVFAVNFAFGELLAPAAERRAAAIKTMPAAGGYKRANTWHRQGGLFTNVGGYDEAGRLADLRQFLFEDGRLRLARRARTATPNADDGHWLLRDVRETRIATDGTRAAELPAVMWPRGGDATLFTTKAVVDPAKLSLTELRARIRQLLGEGLAATRYQVAFWAKALQPLAVLGLVLLATGFVIGPLREVGIGTRLCVGIILGLGLKYLVDVFGPMSVVFAIPPPVAMAVPVAACWLAAALLVRRL